MHALLWAPTVVLAFHCEQQKQRPAPESEHKPTRYPAMCHTVTRNPMLDFFAGNCPNRFQNCAKNAADASDEADLTLPRTKTRSSRRA
eukprot:3648151-Amphidinium_carterae.2